MKKYCIHHIKGHYGTIVFANDLKTALRFIYSINCNLATKNGCEVKKQPKLVAEK